MPYVFVLYRVWQRRQCHPYVSRTPCGVGHGSCSFVRSIVRCHLLLLFLPCELPTLRSIYVDCFFGHPFAVSVRQAVSPVHRYAAVVTSIENKFNTSISPIKIIFNQCNAARKTPTIAQTGWPGDATAAAAAAVVVAPEMCGCTPRFVRQCPGVGA